MSKVLFSVCGLLTLFALKGALFPPTKTINQPVTNVPTSNFISLQNNTESLSVKQVKHLNVNNKRVVLLNAEIDQFTASGVVEQLKELNKTSGDVYLLINSPGGRVLDGASIVSQIQSMKVPVNTVCLQVCASMAAIIHGYGTNRYALDRAILMYHPASGAAMGQVKNMLSMLQTIDKYIDRMDGYLEERSKIPHDKFQSMIAYELWLESEDALKLNLIDGIVSIDNSLMGDASLIETPKQEQNDSVLNKLKSFK